jgi:hypothetical protein
VFVLAHISLSCNTTLSQWRLRRHEEKGTVYVAAQDVTSTIVHCAAPAVGSAFPAAGRPVRLSKLCRHESMSALATCRKVQRQGSVFPEPRITHRDIAPRCSWRLPLLGSVFCGGRGAWSILRLNQQAKATRRTQETKIALKDKTLDAHDVGEGRQRCYSDKVGHRDVSRRVGKPAETLCISASSNPRCRYACLPCAFPMDFLHIRVYTPTAVWECHS